MVGTVAVDQEAQLARLEDHRVEVEPAQVRAGRLGYPLADVLPGPPGVVHPSGIGRQVTAAVHHDDGEPRVPFHHAVEDEVRLRQGGLVGVPEGVDEVVVGQALRVCRALSVDHDRGAQPLDLGPERLQPVGGDLLALDVGADLDAAHPQVGRQVGQLLHRGLRVLQRHRTERDEAVGVPAGRLDHLLVDQSCGPGAQLGVGPVEVLVDRWRDRLDVDAHRVHVREPDLELLHLRADRLELACVDGPGLGRAVAQRGAPGLHLCLAHQVRGGGALAVAVDVDDRPAWSCSGHRASSGSRDLADSTV